jgi:glycosyltransferase involved in cell wall biosynthesis
VLILQWWVTFFAPLWFVLAWNARRVGIDVVYVCHNVLPHELRVWDTGLARWTLGVGNGFVVPSLDEREQLLSLLPGRRVEVVPHPSYDMFADRLPGRNEARRQLALPEKAPVLLFFGIIREYKGLRYLLEAMPRIIAGLADVRLLIAGEFWDDKQPYLSQIERLGIEERVVVVDRYVPNEELPVYFSAADVVVLPYTHVTQSGVVQLAFGFGVPVITTRVGGLPETVTDQETGLLVEPGDPISLADAVCRYFRDGFNQRMPMAVKAARRRFAWETVARAIEGLARHA